MLTKVHTTALLRYGDAIVTAGYVKIVELRSFGDYFMMIWLLK
jgi:hypothetical protein